MLLRAQPASTWAEPSTLQMYAGMLSFVIHTRPKVRRAGQRAVISTLLGSACMRQDEESPPPSSVASRWSSAAAPAAPSPPCTS